MRQALLISLTIIALCKPAGRLQADTSTGDTIAQAKQLVLHQKLAQAATLLEDALPEAGASDRGEILGLLKSSYRALIRQAETDGNRRDADLYRDNLAIIEQIVPAQAVEALTQPLTNLPALTSTGPTSPQIEPARTGANPAVQVPRSSLKSEQALLDEPARLPDPGAIPPLEAPSTIAKAQRSGVQRAGLNEFARNSRASKPGEPEATRSPAAIPDSLPATAAVAINPAGAPSLALPAPGRNASKEPDLADADWLFGEKHYAEAGSVYARLAYQNRLPAQRNQVWAYCRWVALVERINAHPRTPKEWDEIDAEVQSVQRLTPGNWYGEYLRSKVSEARGAGRAPDRAGRLVVRGTQPEEPAPNTTPGIRGGRKPTASSAPPPTTSLRVGESIELPASSSLIDLENAPEPRAGAALGQGQQVTPASAQTSARSDEAPPDAISQAVSSPAQAAFAWQVHETTSFRIFHTDRTLAEQAGLAAEAARTQQGKRWGSPAMQGPWSPRCDLYLYPTARDFARMTGQPEISPGFSTMGISGGRIIARRVNLRADHPQVLTAILPHEVTHVVLADLFKEHQIPRWADEGMAVLSEPLPEQIGRASDLAAPLANGRLFKLPELMSIDYPNEQNWSLYYAQSVSLTQFLVEQGSPEQFVGFVRTAQRLGIEASLRQTYKIAGFADLEDRWLTFARRQADQLTASAPSPSSDLDPSLRR